LFLFTYRLSQTTNFISCLKILVPLDCVYLMFNFNESNVSGHPTVVTLIVYTLNDRKLAEGFLKSSVGRDASCFEGVTFE